MDRIRELKRAIRMAHASGDAEKVLDLQRALTVAQKSEDEAAAVETRKAIADLAERQATQSAAMRPSYARPSGRRALKTSIAVTPETAAIIDPRSAGMDRSTVIRILLGWYAEIVRRERPALAEAEWNAIRDALNGTWLLAEQADVGLLAGGLPVEIADACRLEGLAEKWAVDGAALVAQLDALGFAARLAVIDDAVRFWAAVAAEQGRGDEKQHGGDWRLVRTPIGSGYVAPEVIDEQVEAQLRAMSGRSDPEKQP